MPETRFITMPELHQAALDTAKNICMHHVQVEGEDSMTRHLGLTTNQCVTLYGVPRGGIPAAMMVMNELTAMGVLCVLVDTPDEAEYIVDDLIDSGRTRAHMLELYPDKAFFALFDKEATGDERWYVFPWEVAGEDLSATDIPVRLLQYIGENPARGGLLETPRRFLAAWQHWAAGYKQNPADVLKTFKDGAEQYDDMVLVRDIPVYSHCEHHLAPFFGVAHIAYIPNGRIVGLSKLSRLVDIYARRLQVQERMTNEIAGALETHLQPLGVAVVIECRHLCMESRGIARQGSTTVTSAMHGVFRDNDSARAEFMGLIK